MNMLKKDIVSGILIALLFAIVSSVVQVSRAGELHGNAEATIDNVEAQGTPLT
jgi:hypothetical protein